MRKMHNKTDNSKCKAGRTIPLRDGHDISSRPRLLLRLGCAALALMLAVCAAPLLRRSFDVQLPVVHGVGTETEPENIEIHAVIDPDWDSDTKMEGSDVWYTKKIRIEIGKKMYVREGKTIHMLTNLSSTGNSDNSGIYINGSAELHVYGKITGEFDEVSKQLADSGHFYLYLCSGAIFDADYDNDTYGISNLESSKRYIETIGCNVGSNFPDSVKVWDSRKTPRALVNDKNFYQEDGTLDPNQIDNIPVGTFNKNDPSTAYEYNATPVVGYDRVIWLKGGDDGYVWNAENPTQNPVTVTCKENAKYQMYAKYIPDDAWTWNLDSNPPTATYKVTEVKPSNPGGIIETDYTDEHPSVVGTTATCTEGGKTTYRASVVVNETTYNNEYSVDAEALGHDLRDDWEVTKEPTQTETGTKIRHCHRDGCTYSETAEIDKLGGNEGGGNEGGGNEGGEDHSNDYDWDPDSEWEYTKNLSSGMLVILKNVSTSGDDSKTFGKLQKVSVDGTVIYDKNNNVSADGKFTASSGSIKFMFDSRYLDTLSVGKDHTLKVELSDGLKEYALKEHAFEIKASDGTTQPGGSNNTNNNNDTGKGDWSPQTGDNHFRLFLAGWFFLASAGTIVMLLFQKRKKRYSHR